MSRESYEEYERLGFGPNPLRSPSGVNLPNAQAYFCTRIAALGRVSGQLAASVWPYSTRPR
ncbi:hypothetical protein ABQF35_29530 [Mycobacterium syngnathidarum]